PEFKRTTGGFVATDAALESETGVGRAWTNIRRALIGRRLATAEEHSERVSKKIGLAIFAADNISSSAYATEEAMRILALAGVDAITSAFPDLHPGRVGIAVGLVVLLTIGNLRGIREAGNIFAAPTYLYVLAIFGLIAMGLWRAVSGDLPSAPVPIQSFLPAGT